MWALYKFFPRCTEQPQIGSRFLSMAEQGPRQVIGLHAPDSKVHGPSMGPIWGRQDPGGPHVGPMNLDIWGPNAPPPLPHSTFAHSFYTTIYSHELFQYNHISTFTYHSHVAHAYDDVRTMYELWSAFCLFPFYMKVANASVVTVISD